VAGGIRDLPRIRRARIYFEWLSWQGNPFSGRFAFAFSNGFGGGQFDRAGDWDHG